MTEEKKILSIAVPMYNVDRYITQCLDSFVIPEVMDKIEILAIDDGGTDRSAKIAQGYEALYPDTFRVIRKENGGHGSVINRGIEEASGRYFRVVDGDDQVAEEGFIHLVEHLEETDADMVLSNYYWVDHASGKRSTEVEEICPGIRYGVTYPFEAVGDRIFMKMHAITYKTEVIREQPERLDEHCFYVDTEYMLFPLPYVKTVSAIKDFVYLYRIGLPGQSMSAEKLQRQCGQHERVLDRLLAFYGRHKEGTCGKVLAMTLARILTSQYKIYLMFPRSHKEQLLAMEERIREGYPDIYWLVTQKAIWFLRKTGYRSYGLVSFLVRKWVR